MNRYDPFLDSSGPAVPVTAAPVPKPKSKRQRSRRTRGDYSPEQALARAVGSQSMANYVPIIEGFKARGIPEAEILPRENVFTYQAWLAKGRQVRRGEKGVKVTTMIPVGESSADPSTGEEIRGGRRIFTGSTVFHISQTDLISHHGGTEDTEGKKEEKSSAAAPTQVIPVAFAPPAPPKPVPITTQPSPPPPTVPVRKPVATAGWRARFRR